MSPLPRPPAWTPPSEFDEYKLVKQLGRGRTGVVHVAHDTLLDRHVAVKFIPALDETLLARFLNEARAAARIQHPNVATLYRVGRIELHAYLVWELVRGKSLDQFEKPVAPEIMLRIATDVVRGLAAAHRRGVLHRDIKPGNIVVADGGEAKLVDFGLAALLDVPQTPEDARAEDLKSGEDSSAPAEDGVVATPYFMSPEAWRGEGLDARSDLYSLGLVMYELLAGAGPFRHLMVKELANETQREAPRPLHAIAPTVPEGFARVVDRCLKLDRNARYGNADELLSALDVISPTRGHAAVPEGNPYRGLRTYEAEHRALFFGRTRPLQLAIERLRAEPLLVVTGDSGVGKSSLCAAGVLPAIADGALEDGRRWIVGRTVPGRTPLRNVSTLLAQLLGLPVDEVTRTLEQEPRNLGRVVRGALREELGLLLYIDQMEELVTLESGDEAARVSEALGALADGLPGARVIATARSDFLSRLAGLPAFAERLPPALLLLGPMLEADIREAIVGPASLKGATYESDDLVTSLVESTLAAEGSLPLLQFTLAELWERRDRETNTITAAALASVGGVSGALARHADAVLVSLSAPERLVARQLLLRLVTVDDTRARRSDEELRAVSPSAPVVLEALVRGRLLVASEAPEGATYEIAHEALVRGWGTLAHWLAEEAELRAARHRLEHAAAEWQRAGKQRDLLWSGRQLAELDERALEGIASRERAFVAESRRARRTVRWVRRGLVAAALLAVVGTYAGTRLVHRRDVNRAVAAELTAADARLDAAHVAMTSRAAARTAAFAAWDRKATADAERTWKTMLDQTAVARVGLADAAAALERALLRDADRTDVRARYGDVLLERALLADDDGRREEYNELVARLAAYDADGARRARLAAPAHLTLTVTPEARISAGGFGPDEVGSHPRSTSPFGVTDLSGNVWEWVSSSLVSEQVVARGGSYYFAGNTARVTNRELPEASYRDLTVGLRVCASSPAAIVE